MVTMMTNFWSLHDPFIHGKAKRSCRMAGVATSVVFTASQFRAFIPRVTNWRSR